MSELVKAILATTRAVGTLGKAAVNPHGNYRYVSIDKFYETAARAAADNGLNWSLRETGFEVMPSVGKTGAIRISYAVDVMHESGVMERDFSAVSIIHPIQGAQTVGSSMSYADKVVMRQLFKIATGEKDIDADETDNTALDLEPAPPAPKPSAAPRDESRGPKIEIPGEEGDWSQVEAVFREFVPTCQTNEALQFFWSDNVPAIEAIKENHPDMHKRVVAMFTARKTELKKGK